MLLYSIIMFLVATLFTVLGIAIYKGKTDLIHDYHQTYDKYSNSKHKQIFKQSYNAAK